MDVWETPVNVVWILCQICSYILVSVCWAWLVLYQNTLSLLLMKIPISRSGSGTLAISCQLAALCLVFLGHNNWAIVVPREIPSMPLGVVAGCLIFDFCSIDAGLSFSICRNPFWEVCFVLAIILQGYNCLNRPGQ